MNSFVYKKVSSSARPVDVFESLRFRNMPILLDSSSEGDPQSQFSFIVFDPFIVVQAKNKKVEITRSGQKSETINKDPFIVMRELLQEYEIGYQEAPFPFIGGAVGYLGYDLKDYIEDIASCAHDDYNMSDLLWGFYDSVIVFEHRSGCFYLSCCDFGSNGQHDDNRDIESRLDLLKEIITKSENMSHMPMKNDEPPICRKSRENNDVNWNYTKESYLSTIQKAIDYIYEGDIFQVNLSQRFSMPFHGDSWDLYKTLRTGNPAPFSAYMHNNDVAIACSSPETFLELRDRTVITRPMKGTIRRGNSIPADAIQKEKLCISEKDKAELAMIVDMERNDIGRVCEVGSVHVIDERTIETYATVFQGVATVGGTLRKDKDCLDLIRACFPGGSITGAPKIRAMEIIEELEPTKRALYTGSIGYIDFRGNMHLNIVIRTIIVINGTAYLQVGGGIVADSEPEKEYAETLDKARALRSALDNIL